MSVAVMAWVWENGPNTTGDRLVLLAIADHADDSGVAFPSMRRIAEKSCMTERGARGVVRRLEAQGWLSTTVGGGRGGASVYTILMQKSRKPLLGNEVETRNAVPVKEPKTRNEKPGIQMQKPGTRLQKPGTRVPPNHQ